MKEKSTMEMNPELKDGKLILSPQGRVDQTTAAAFQESLLKEIEPAQSKIIILNMAGINYMSSVGLRAIMMAFKQLKAEQGQLLIAALPPVVKEVFQISRFDTVLKCFDDVETALTSS